MAVITPPPGPGWAPPPAPGAGWSPSGPAAEASPAGQLASFLLTALSLCLVLSALDVTGLAALSCVVLAAGVGLGLAVDLRRVFENLPGVVAGVLAMGALGVLVALGTILGFPFPPYQAFPLLFLLVLGMDWRRVERLRALVFLCGVPVVLVVGMELGWTLPAAIVWFVGAIVTLWVLEQDRRAALDAPVPVGPPPTGPGNHPLDLVRTLGLALVIGLAAAFLLGNPSCSFKPDPPDVSSDPYRGYDGSEGSGDPADGGRSFEQYDLEGRNQERSYQIDGNGERTFVDPKTGQPEVVRDEGGRTVVRDGDGNVVAELDEDGVVAVDPDTGDEQRYQVDEDGRFYLETPDGGRVYLGEEDGEPVLRDEDDRIVARGDGDGNLVVRDPNGELVVEDPDGDGLVPVPDGAVRDGVGAVGEPDGRQFETDGDRTIVTDPDGSSRVHDRDEDGNARLRIDEPGEEPRTYVFDPDGDGMWVDVYDDAGERVDRYRYGPDAASDPGSTPAIPDQAGEPEGDQGEGGDSSDSSNRVWWLLGAAAIAIAAATWWYLRRKGDDDPETDRTWAEELLARLEALGRERGRRRAGSETVLEYTAALADGVLPDERLETVGRVLSDALFGPTQPPAETQEWAKATVDEVEEAHPIGGRRRSREPAATSS